MIKRDDFSEEQEIAYQHILKFVKSTDRQMTLTGYAGTGKTSLLNVLVNDFEGKGYEVVCTAPTNEAVRVISTLTGHKYNQTIYSLLGLALVHEDDKEPVLRPQGTPKISEYDIIFIDEASMIHQELFDLIQEQLVQFTYVKVIYIGDSAQLPPVKDVNKESKVFSLENKVGLQTVQRVASGNPIIGVATIIRNDLFTPVDKFNRTTSINDDGTGIKFHDNREEFLDLMYSLFTSDEYKTDSNYVRAIAYTNKAVDALNIHIRRKIFKDVQTLDQFMVGEKVMVDEPIVESFGKVSKIIYSVGERLLIKKCSLETDVEFGFKYWSMLVENYEETGDDRISKRIKVIHKDSLLQYHATLSIFAKEAKQKSFTKITKDGKSVPMYSKGECWSRYFAFKNQYSWLKYIYATTTHKAQGSTIKNIFVIERDLNKLTWDDVERNKLKYVAFTRASKTLHILQ